MIAPKLNLRTGDYAQDCSKGDRERERERGSSGAKKSIHRANKVFLYHSDEFCDVWITFRIGMECRDSLSLPSHDNPVVACGGGGGGRDGTRPYGTMGAWLLKRGRQTDTKECYERAKRRTRGTTTCFHFVSNVKSRARVSGGRGTGRERWSRALPAPRLSTRM